MKNFLSIEACSRAEIEELVESSISLKEARNRRDFSSKPLSDQCWGIIFSKASTRTRISFEVGIRELGGSAMFLSPRDLQLGRGEPIKDTARVMGRMLHGAVIRNDSQIEVDYKPSDEFATRLSLHSTAAARRFRIGISARITQLIRRQFN